MYQQRMSEGEVIRREGEGVKRVKDGKNSRLNREFISVVQREGRIHGWERGWRQKARPADFLICLFFFLFCLSFFLFYFLSFVLSFIFSLFLFFFLSFYLSIPFFSFFSLFSFVLFLFLSLTISFCLSFLCSR